MCILLVLITQAYHNARFKKHAIGCLTLDDDSITNLQNITNLSPNDTVSPQRHESPGTSTITQCTFHIQTIFSVQVPWQTFVLGAFVSRHQYNAHTQHDNYGTSAALQSSAPQSVICFYPSNSVTTTAKILAFCFQDTVTSQTFWSSRFPLLPGC